ncbi:MAG TPA: ABC transporter permease [Chitinophagaceae bacterium]|nr:ABC transporter permease [Chitinophagaceae bacterium]
MFKNYFKLAIRSLFKNKAHTFINISGLAVGMASVILILLWIQNEMSHDRFYKKIDRIYTANNRDRFNGLLQVWNNTPKILGPTIKQDYPEVEDVVRVNSYGANFLLSVGDKHLNLHGDFVDSTFFNIFDLPLISGNAKTCLDGHNSIVLTQQLAKKLFGNDNVMGKIIRIDSSDNFVVTAIVKDLPNNTSFDFEYLLPWTYSTKLGMDDKYWGNNSVYTFILLKPGASQTAFDAKLRDISKNHTKGAAQPVTSQVFTQPLKDAWLYSKSENGRYVGSRIEQVRTFGMIAAFILLIACINFMNLSTARSEKRAKEVGIRKVVGAQKMLLVSQFIGESVMLAFIAGVLAVIIVQLSLQGFNQLVGKQLSIDYGNAWYWAFALLFILFTGFLAGSYPAFYLSAFQPVKVLKGTFKAANAAVTPRKILVVLQFTFAIGLIISTIIVEQEVKYAQDRDLGYNKDHLAFVIMFGDDHKNYDLIKQELLSSGAATAVTATSAPMTEHWSDSWGFSWPGSKGDDAKLDFDMFGAEQDFTSSLGLTVVQGRDFDLKKYPSDSTGLLLNETAVEKMRLKNPIGTVVKDIGDTSGAGLHVIGVIKDFVLETPYEPVRPMLITGPKYIGYDVINFKLNPAMQTQAALSKAEQVFKKYNPQYPFNYRFYDAEYAKKFQDEQRTGTFAGLFAGLTIFISCLGLFGLAAYMAENRIKEIGVRKVLGASVTGIVTLLSKDFLKLVVIAFLIASSIAWYLMHQWLLGYTYRINIQWWVFVAAGVLSVVITLLTIGYQSIKAAMANPVKSLKTE